MPHQPGHQPPGQQPQCPEPCCGPTDILCVSIPCPIQIVLLGIPLTVELPCIRIFSDGQLTPAQVQQILAALQNLLGSLGSALPTAGAAKA